MKYLLFCLLLTASSAAFSQSPANFSGLWSTSTGNYISIHQSGNTIIAATLGIQANTGGAWEAFQATVVGQSATAITIWGYVNSTVTVRLTSPTTILITQLACSPVVPGWLCAYPYGAQFTASKVF
jgi:hypothetical protein